MNPSLSNDPTPTHLAQDLECGANRLKPSIMLCNIAYRFHRVVTVARIDRDRSSPIGLQWRHRVSDAVEGSAGAVSNLRDFWRCAGTQPG